MKTPKKVLYGTLKKSDFTTYTHRHCRKCDQIKPLTDTYFFSYKAKGKQRNMKLLFRELCKTCTQVRTKKATKKKVSSLLGYMQRAMYNVRQRGKKQKVEVKITAEDLVDIFNCQTGLCSLSGMPLDWQTFAKGRSPLTCSIDRIEPKKGYVKDNVRLLCFQVNTMKHDLSDVELRKWCLRAIAGLDGHSPNTLIANFNTLADVADRLAVEISKVAYFENRKREAHFLGDTSSVVEWDSRSRDACEYRSMLRNEFNAVLAEIVRTKQYQTLPELRTFSKPPKSVAELLDDMYYRTSNDVLKGQLAKAIERELSTGETK